MIPAPRGGAFARCDGTCGGRYVKCAIVASFGNTRRLCPDCLTDLGQLLDTVRDGFG